MSILMITHDLGIVAEMADDVAVMYASKVVETRAGRASCSPTRCTPTPSDCSSRGRDGPGKPQRSG